MPVTDEFLVEQLRRPRTLRCDAIYCPLFGQSNLCHLRWLEITEETTGSESAPSRTSGLHSQFGYRVGGLVCVGLLLYAH